MSKRPGGRHAVYVGEIPDGRGESHEAWWPDSIIDLPDRLERVKVLDEGLTLCEAASLVRDFNREQLARPVPIFDGRWAFLVFRLNGGATA